MLLVGVVIIGTKYGLKYLFDWTWGAGVGWEYIWVLPDELKPPLPVNGCIYLLSWLNEEENVPEMF